MSPTTIRNCLKSVSVLVVFFLLFSLSGVEAATNNIERIGGANRFETSALIAFNVYDSADTVIIARGDQEGQFADGLASSVLAGALNAPVLLTMPDRLPSSIERAIKILGATKAIVLGGSGAISETVVGTLENINLEVERIEGKNRYETAVRIAEAAKETGNMADYAIIVNGYCPADSLVAAPAAFKNKAAILQVAKDRVPQVTQDALIGLGIQELYIVGGSGVVSELVKVELSRQATINNRLGGANRFETSVRVAEELFAGETDAVVTGGLDANQADSIGACILGRQLLYVRQDGIPNSVTNYLNGMVTPSSGITIIGGPGAVSETVETRLSQIISGEVADTTAYDEIILSIPTDNNDGTYTSASWLAFESAIASCNLTLTAADGQAALDAEVLKIQAALDLLVLADENSSDEPISFFESEPNNSLEQANLVDGCWDGSHKYYIFGTITNYSFDLDYFRFDITKPGTINIFGVWLGDIMELGWEDDLAVILKNANDDIIAIAGLYDYPAGSFRELELEVPAGTYYILVMQTSEYEFYVGEVYGLSVQFKPKDEDNGNGEDEGTVTFFEFEPNNSMEQANLVNHCCDGSRDYNIFGTITNYSFDLDYFGFDITKPGTIDILGFWLGDYYEYVWEDDLAVGLLDSNGDTVAWAELCYPNSPDCHRSLVLDIPAGTYYIVVFQCSDYEYLYVGEIYGLSVQFKPTN